MAIPSVAYGCRDFNGTTNYMSVAAAPVTAVPLTLACWFKATTTPGGSMFLIEITTAGSDNAYFALIADSTGVLKARTKQIGGGSSSFHTTSYTDDEWHHGCAVFPAVNSRYCYQDGVKSTPETTSRTPASLAATWMCAREDSPTHTQFYEGLAAHFAIWDVALSDDEVIEQATGLMPPYTRPSALKGYWPSYGVWTGEYDVSPEGNHITSGGSSSSGDGPPIYAPRCYRQTLETAAAGPTATVHIQGAAIQGAAIAA
jgi:hypothetical protein